MKAAGHTFVVSDRLPMRYETDRATPSYLRPNNYELIYTLDSVLRVNGGTWIGCANSEDVGHFAELLRDWRWSHGYSLAPFFLGAEERADYQKFAKTVIWPLFHGLASHSRTAMDSWSGYCKVNGKFAEAIQIAARNEDFVWVHDYPILMVASLLRANGWQGRIGYFHHIPFPKPSILKTLPWRVELLHGLLQFDHVGFQTDCDRRNFMASVLEFLPISSPLEIDGKFDLRVLDREIRVGTYPVGIDYQTFSREAATANTVAAAKAIKTYVGGTRIVLGVSPMEESAGICESLTAFHRALECYPELRGRVTMIQAVMPRADGISDRDPLKLRIESAVERINGTFGNFDWTPVLHYYKQLTQAQVTAFYCSADVALITPLKDGMTLTAKEFCACKRDEHGVLVLSQFAGAAEELKAGALLVNPNDVDHVAHILNSALGMSESEQQERMAALRSQVRTHNVFNWSHEIHCDAALLRASSRLSRIPEKSVRARLSG